MAVTVAMIGAGGRGTCYANYMKTMEDKIKVTAIVEPRMDRLKKQGEYHEVAEDMLFLNEDDFYAKGKVVDAVMIASMDRQHFYSIMKCMDLGYDILVEKPITINEEELKQIDAKQKETGARVMVCHVLRYVPFFENLKDLLVKEEIGKTIGIDYTEYIGNWHMGVSFVRGQWRNDKEASPIILQKTCHDFDILAWLLDSDYEEVYSNGELKFFKPEFAPKGSTDKCVDCPHKDTCVYNFEKIYEEGGYKSWVGRPEVWENAQHCIFKIKDNNVCDHQVGLLKFKNGVDVTFTMTAFHQHSARYLRIFGTEGSIVADMYKNTIEITKYVAYPGLRKESRTVIPGNFEGGHGGGDKGVVEDFAKFVADKNHVARTIIDQSFQSHYMSFDMEQSRVTGEVVKNER